MIAFDQRHSHLGFWHAPHILTESIRLRNKFDILGGLPLVWQNGFIFTTDGNLIQLDQDYREIRREKFSDIISCISGSVGLFMNLQEEIYSVDLQKFTVSKKVNCINNLSGTVFGKLLIINDNSKNSVLQYDIAKDRIVLSSIKPEGHIGQYLCNGSIITASMSDYSKKICFDYITSNKCWELVPEDLNLETPTTKLGRSYLIDTLVMGCNEHREYFAVDSKTGRQVWNCKQPSKSLGQGVYADFKHHSINVVDYYNRKGKGKYHEFVFMVMNCKTGKLEKEIDLSDQIYALDLIPRQGLERGVYGQFSISDTHIFFGADNRLIALEKESGKLKVIYEHDAELMFSRIALDKLFYTDNNFKLLVFDEGNSLS